MTKLIEYLQSPDGLRMTAFVATSLILIAIVLRIDPIKSRKPSKEDLWTAEGYYNYLLAVIKSSNDMLLLQAAWEMVENTWFQKTFRVPVRRFTRNRYYIRLTKAYAKKEAELTKVKIELCTN